MGKIIAVMNEKGGVAKTTTAHAILCGLTKRGYKALGIDLDIQSNLSSLTGAEKGKGIPSIVEIMINDYDPLKAVQHTKSGDIIISSLYLRNIDSYITDKAEAEDLNRKEILKRSLNSLLSEYDYIIIDTPRASGELTDNILTASDYVVIPANSEPLSYECTERFLRIVDRIKESSNPRLNILGILMTEYNDRTILHRDMLQNMNNLAKQHKLNVFSSRIRHGVAIGEAQALKQNIFTYAPKSNPVKDYSIFLDEMLELIK